MPTIEALTEAWKEAKRLEEEAKARRIDIESAIYEQVQHQLKDKGTTTFECGLKIVTGFTEEWDQSRVQNAYEIWPQGYQFPFEGVWKPDGKAITYLREHVPAVYQLIGDALTLKPKKPAFSVKE